MYLAGRWHPSPNQKRSRYHYHKCKIFHSRRNFTKILREVKEINQVSNVQPAARRLHTGQACNDHGRPENVNFWQLFCDSTKCFSKVSFVCYNNVLWYKQDVLLPKLNQSLPEVAKLFICCCFCHPVHPLPLGHTTKSLSLEWSEWSGLDASEGDKEEGGHFQEGTKQKQAD